MSKKRRKGRAIDHVWRFVKFRGDACLYACCSCGFRYDGCKHVSRGPDMFDKIVIAPERLYNYCPQCGARKTKYIEDIEKLDWSWWEEL